MNDVATELRASNIPLSCMNFVYCTCNGEGGIDVDAWVRCYGGSLYTGPLTAVFNTRNKLWEGKQGPAGISHAFGAAQFEPATYEEMAAKTGFTDVEPQSQLANTWKLMQTVYGSNLESDITAGRQAQVATALNKTWTSLAKLTKFQSYYIKYANLFITPVPPAPPAPPVDPEIQAITDILKDLTPLDAAARKRVVSYVAARLAIGM